MSFPFSVKSYSWSLHVFLKRSLHATIEIISDTMCFAALIFVNRNNKKKLRMFILKM